MLHSTVIGLKNRTLIVLFSSLTLGLTACGGGGSKKAEPAKTGLETSDFEKQVYAKSSGSDDTTFLSFLSGGTGNNYEVDGQTKEKGTFAWSITDGKLDLGTSGGDNINFALKSKEDNKYTFTITESNKTFDTEFFRAKPLTVADFDGKTLKLDTSGNSDCSATTMKTTGSTVSFKEICGGHFSESTMSLTQVSGLDNMVELANASGSSKPFSVYIALVKGSLADGTFATVENPNEAELEGVQFTLVETTNKEVEAGTTNPPVNSNPFQVVDKKLILYSKIKTANVKNYVYYGVSSTPQEPVFINSFEADISLVDSKITGNNARARIAYYQRIESISGAWPKAEIFVAIERRASGVTAKAFLTINGVDTALDGINGKTLNQGESYHFKIMSEGDNVVLTLGSHTASISKSSIGSTTNDAYISYGNFFAGVKQGSVGDFATASIDNVVLVREKGGVVKTISRNFDDGIVPVADEDMNNIHN